MEHVASAARPTLIGPDILKRSGFSSMPAFLIAESTKGF
jgi:hypothetical protein